MLISAIKFQNFKVLRNALLPLGRTTLIVGPNGSGKTTALQAIKYLAGFPQQTLPAAESLRSMGARPDEAVRLEIMWCGAGTTSGIASDQSMLLPNAPTFLPTGDRALLAGLRGARVYAFQQERIAAQVPLTPSPELDEAGGGLPAVLTNLQDKFPERFEALNKDLGRWLPEFDRVLLGTPQNGKREFMLRTRSGAHRIHAHYISQGSLFALALLTIAHLPDPPSIVALEDPDRGMHPRLLREILDATERLANPQAFEDSRTPVQVLITTHSPYLVDLFRDRPEDVVIVEKGELSSNFKRLSEIPHIEEILSDAHLGEAWFRGSLGGVPANV